MHRQIAGTLTGRVTKWVVLVFWIGAFAVLAPFGMKLSEVQNNEASSWLPESAEATRALERMEPFQDPDAIPTVVVYERTSGLTATDRAAATSDARAFKELDGVIGDVVGPIVSEDGQAMQTVVTFEFGPNGWEEMPDVADRLR